MTRDQILARLQQEYMRRREDNLRVFERRQEEACGRCPGLKQLLDARHGTVMQGVRASLLARSKQPGDLARQMADLNGRIAQTLQKGGFPADYLQPVYTCPLCRDEGYVYDPSRRMCRCMEQELTRRLLAENGLDGNQSFESFDETLYDDQPNERGLSPRDLAISNRSIAQRYADTYPDTATRDLLVMGKSGLGKTFLLQCIARRAYRENDSGLLAPVMDAPLLLIDDLGTEPLMNNVTVTQLFNLLNERQLAGRHTVISTNLNPRELQERYTERIASRLLDESSCARLGFVGGDIRRNPNRKAANP